MLFLFFFFLLFFPWLSLHFFFVFFLVLFCFSSKSKYLLTSQMCYPSHRKKTTDSHFRVFKEYPQKSQIWKSETSPNQGTWLGIPLLRLVSLCQIWDFYGYSLKYPKISNNGNLLFFSCVKWLHALTQFPQWKPWVPGDTYWCILILKLWRTQVLGHFC